MERQVLTTQFHDNHKAFIAYINSIPDDDFVLSKNEKWSPGQQLDHVLKCVVPLLKALSNKAFIETKFGRIQRPVLSYEEVIKNYKHGLENGGKAPERFLPEKVELIQREVLEVELMNNINALASSLENYSDDELDSLILPHPFLGSLTIREMLFLMTYHAEHHHAKTKENLQG